MRGVRFIAGSGRSGTTWVQDALANANGLRPVFEPLNPYASEIGWRYAHCVLEPGDRCDDLKCFLGSVSDGRKIRLWTKYRRQWRWLLPRKDELNLKYRGPNVMHRWVRFVREVPELFHMGCRDEPVIKCIWSNLMLEWLKSEYDCRLLFVVRHPGAVIESELRNNWNPMFAVERFRRDPQFTKYTSGRYQQMLSRTLDGVEALAVRWLVENQLNIERARSIGMTVVHYENLVSEPEIAWQKCCSALGLSGVPTRTAINKPSQQSARRNTDFHHNELSDANWMHSLADENKERIQTILDEVEFRDYSMNSARPIACREMSAVVPDTAVAQ